MTARRLGHFELSTRLGAGAMGEVWQATDTTLGRQVAVKILPEVFQTDPERLARFEREAKLLASLSHPNIATIHGLHEQQPSGEDETAVRFLVMELVPGQELAESLARGPLSIDQALHLARQIAEALRAAHAAGVIHRDLKPANVKITPTDEVRVLDFGLAKALEPGAVASGASGSALSDGTLPTMTSAGTVAGVVLGTPAYMSPEQARGRPVDRRADVWAFGCVLYEMLTGREPFRGETNSDTIAAVLRAEPDWNALPAATPPAIRRLLRRCLQKDAERRLGDIGDARLEIDEALDPSLAAADAGGGEATPHVAAGRRSARLPWMLTAVLAVLAGAMLVTLLVDRQGQGATPRATGSRLSINLPPELVLVPGTIGAGRMTVSSDGTLVAFTAREEDTVQLYVRSLTSDEIVVMPETRGASSPFFSPDGRWIGFFGGGNLKKVAVSGGTPVVVCEARTGRGGVWLEGDTIVFAPEFDSGLWQVPAAGGEARPVTTPDREANERTHRWPGPLPGGEAVLFTIGTLDNPGYYDDAVLAAADLATGRITKLIEGGSLARYAANHLIYARGGELLAVGFDPRALKVSGAPVSVLQGVAGEATSGVADFAFSGLGDAWFVPVARDAPVPALVHVDRGGRSQPLLFEGFAITSPRISPEGNRLAVTIGRGLGEGDIWVYDLETKRNTRLTFHASGAQPLWSPDGRRLLYGFTRGGEEGLVSQLVDGSTEPERIVPWVGGSVLFPDSWHPAGRNVLISVYGGAGGSDIVVYDFDDQEIVPLLDGPHAEGSPSLSPRGDWFAYVSDESGRFEVYVRPFPGPGGKFQVSTDGGKGPIWSAQGDEIFFTDGDRLMSASVQTSPTFRAEVPREVFRKSMRRELGLWADFAVEPDGRGFYLFERSPETIEPRQVDVLFDFADRLRTTH